MKTKKLIFAIIPCLLLALLLLSACSTTRAEGESKSIYCNVIFDEYTGFPQVKETEKNQASYQAEVVYDTKGQKFSCEIKTLLKTTLIYEMKYNNKGLLCELKYENILGKHRILYEYDNRAQLISQNRYVIPTDSHLNDFQLSETIIYDYNVQGLCTKIAFTYHDGRNDDYMELKYNENGNLISATRYDINAKILFEHLYTYNSNRSLATKKVTDHEYWQEEYLEVYEYQGNALSKISTYDANNRLEKVRVYDIAGNQTLLTTYRYSDAISAEIVQEDYTESQYDKKNNLIKHVEACLRDGTFYYIYEHEYEYDSNDNRLTDKFSHGQTLVYEIKYEYEKNGECIKSTVLHASNKTIAENDGYIDGNIFNRGPTLSSVYFDLYNLSGVLTQNIRMNVPSGNIERYTTHEYHTNGVMAKETTYDENDDMIRCVEYDDNEEIIRTTEKLQHGWIKVEEENQWLYHTDDNRLFLRLQFNPNDTTGVVAYDASNNVIFEREGEWKYYSMVSSDTHFVEAIACQSQNSGKLVVEFTCYENDGYFNVHAYER